MFLSCVRVSWCGACRRSEAVCLSRPRLLLPSLPLAAPPPPPPVSVSVSILSPLRHVPLPQFIHHALNRLLMFGDGVGSLRYLFPEPEMLPRAPLWVSRLRMANTHWSGALCMI